jgi:energy-coupling factor transport system ATP-binding protein
MIEFKGVCFRYPGESVLVLNELSFRIPGQGVTAIMGANGSGKSTAALCMNGTLLPATGSVTLDGKSSADTMSAPFMRRTVGMVFQDPNNQLTSLTVERELAFGLENIGADVSEMRERVEEYLRLFGLERYRTLLPSSLSGGEKQRVAVAAAAIMEPRYLVLDEATSLLSPAARKKILHDVMVNAAKQRSSLVLITQFPQEAMLANRLLVLCKGALAWEGNPADLLRDGATLKSLGIQVPLGPRLGINAIQPH